MFVKYFWTNKWNKYFENIGKHDNVKNKVPAALTDTFHLESASRYKTLHLLSEHMSTGSRVLVSVKKKYYILQINCVCKEIIRKHLEKYIRWHMYWNREFIGQVYGKYVRNYFRGYGIYNTH